MRVNVWICATGATTWVEWNPATNEVESVGVVNPSSITYEIEYRWRNRTDSYTLNAFTAETIFSIPPGQRFTLPPPDPYITAWGNARYGSDLYGFDIVGHS